MAARDAYRQWRDDNQRRPTALEFFRHGYRPRTVAAAQDGWLNFVRSEGDLTDDEAACVEAWSHWFRMLETTALNRNYKMLVLRVLLDREELPGGMELTRLSLACRRTLLAEDASQRSGDGGEQSAGGIDPGAAVDPRTASDAEWCAWWKKWPIARWLDEQSGLRWFRLVDHTFQFSPNIPEPLRPAFARLTSELVDWRLAAWTASRTTTDTADAETMGFDASVSHVNGKPILFLPAVERVPGRPVGPVEVRLPDGQVWTFRCVKVACNVASPKDTAGNQLPQLLRQWFGPDAGLPGTQFRVQFRKAAEGWQA
ncbi:MAG: type III restriction endonuclease subunit R, partial [Planctomycetota bacterium]